MISLSRCILESYQVRKSKKQKDAFIALLRSFMPDLTIQKGGLFGSRNLIAGDVETAQVVLAAHYDTCAWMPLPNFITPKNPLLAILYSFVLIVPMAAIVYLYNLVLNFFTADYEIHYFTSLALWFGMLFLLMFGPANRHTANDNTSGVITLCEIYASLSPAQRQKVAFVFFDHEEAGLLGSSAFRSRYKKQMQNKLLINFDCVSDGDHILLAISKKARPVYADKLLSAFHCVGEKQIMAENAEKIYYPSDQMGFPKTVAVAALKHKKGIGYYMDKIHTHKDTVFMEENIHLLRDSICRYLGTL